MSTGYKSQCHYLPDVKYLHFRPGSCGRTWPALLSSDRVHRVGRVDPCPRPDAIPAPIGPLPDALEPDIHCVRTHWNRGFMAFQLVRLTWTVVLTVLTVPVWPESGFREAAPGRDPLAKRHCAPAA